MVEIKRAWDISINSAPATEPISTTEAKSHARIDISDDDTLIGTYIVAARNAAEAATNRPLITQTWNVYLDGFPAGEGRIRLPLPPVQSISSINYLDADGTSTLLATTVYELLAHSGPQADYSYVVLKHNQEWPATKDHPRAVTIVMICGYGGASSVPDEIKLGMKEFVAEAYKNRENTGAVAVATPQSSAMLWAPYKMGHIA